MTRPLTYKQNRFIEEYMHELNNVDTHPNHTAAAIRAGYSTKCAKEIAYDLIHEPRIKKRIDELKADLDKKLVKRLGITRERILQELATIAFANLKHVMTQDEDGNTHVNLAYLSDERSGPISELSVRTVKGQKQVKIKLADKRQALIDIAKMMGWASEKVEVSNTSLEKLIEASMSPSTVKEKDLLDNDETSEEEVPSEEFKPVPIEEPTGGLIDWNINLAS